MALIVCPECGKTFSDKAPSCPECGCPTSAIIEQNNITLDRLLDIANNAFNDGRYEEAYPLFSQIYVQNPNNPQVLVRLGLATAAKDYFGNGIPNSTFDLIRKGLESTKQAASSNDAFLCAVTPLILDIDAVINDTKSTVSSDLLFALKKLEHERSVDEMFTDAVFMPLTVSQRNIYEDRRTIERNKKILENALSNKNVIVRTLDVFSSGILKMIQGLITEPVNSDTELYAVLGHFVIDKDDAGVYESLTDNPQKQESVCGLCYGEETTIIEYSDAISFMFINGKVIASSFMSPKGHLLLTNYKIIYNANKEKYSYEKSLDNLTKIYVGALFPQNDKNAFSSHDIVLTFSDGVRISIAAQPTLSGATWVTLANEMLKMPNR